MTDVPVPVGIFDSTKGILLTESSCFGAKKPKRQFVLFSFDPEEESKSTMVHGILTQLKLLISVWRAL
jgi:hypothetical protein